MKLVRFFARLFEKLCRNAVVYGLRSELNALREHERVQSILVKKLEERNDSLIESIDKQYKYQKELLCRFEAKGSMTFMEYAEWHNAFVKNSGKS